MRSMTTYKRGQIVLVPFPFTDFSTLKQRSALVLSPTAYNRKQNDVIIVAITSQLESYKNRKDVYRIDGQEQRDSGLPRPGIVRPDKITVVDQRLIRRILGTLPQPTVDRIAELTARAIGYMRA